VNIRVKKIIKRDGRIVDFDSQRIEIAIRKAMLATGKYDEKLLKKVVQAVLKIVDEKFGEIEQAPHVEDIQDIVELVLVKYDLYEVAKAYILYRKEREKIRKEKMAILNKNYVDEVDKSFSINAVRLMASRYLLRDENGKIIEGPKQLFERVAALVVIPDIVYDERVFSKHGGQAVHPYEEFNPTEWLGKLGLGKCEKGFKIYWNEWHLECIKKLYDELNIQGKMKISWSMFLSKIAQGEFDNHYDDFMKYYRLMTEKKFLPNSPTLFNAGTRLGQLSACFVLNIDDDMESIMKAATDAAIIFKSGGGVGINYSKLRAEGDIVSSTKGVASGPVSFMKIIDTVTEVVKQGGKRRGANMGILEIWHPDIEKFILAKSKEGNLENFNLSVMITPDFWNYYSNDKPYPLRNPRDGKVWREINPKTLFHMIAEMAWRTGDPGVLFMDNINRRNIMVSFLGDIKSTNPCGEEPLYPYESCNLGSINLYAFIKVNDSGVIFDWNDYSETIMIAQRFLDNIIDVNKFPIREIEENTKKTRKIGLGLMGLADTLFALGIPYNSEEGFALMRKFAEYLTYYAMKASIEMSKKRGEFPLFNVSNYVKGDMPIEGYYYKELWTLNWDEIRKEIMTNGIRNAELTTIAPTGSISMLVDTSSGIEPQYALVYEKRVTAGQFFYVDVEFERQLRERGLYDESLLKKIADNGGSLQEIVDIPEDMKNVFLVAYDIPWWDHIRAQAEISKWICAAVSKTINMPSWVSIEDVEKAFYLAYKLNLKGLTIYRDGSKGAQVLVTPSQRKGGYVKHIKNETLNIMSKLGIIPKLNASIFIQTLKSEDFENQHSIKKGVEVCPECSSRRFVYEEKCIKCLDCGWIACVVS
jgi:ribonucleoside-diphosphate reductase alpha chain